MTLSVTFSKEELPALRKVLDRAMNTWEPQNQPPWLGELSDRVEAAISRPGREVFSVLSVGKSTEAGRELQGLIFSHLKAHHRSVATGAGPDPDAELNPPNGGRMSHTPGPWHVANGVQIRSQRDQIAKAWMMRDGEGKANAALMAAAPDLLAALEGLLADTYLSDSINNDRMAPARAAVASATGSAP